MTQWNVYCRTEEVEVIKHGINWWALVFGWIWALYSRLIWIGLAGLVIFAFLKNLPHETPWFIRSSVYLAYMLTFGLQANKWLGSKLQKAGYLYLGKIEAKNEQEAKLMAAIAKNLPDQQTIKP